MDSPAVVSGVGQAIERAERREPARTVGVRGSRRRDEGKTCRLDEAAYYYTVGHQRH